MLAELAFGENLRDQLIEKLHDVKNNITLEVAIDKVRNWRTLVSKQVKWSRQRKSSEQTLM